MFKRKLIPVALGLAVSLLTGCTIIVIGVGTAGLAGYAVYKAGDAVVTGMGKAGKATGTVIFFNGDFKTQCAGDVSAVWQASGRAFRKAGFGTIHGSYDALSGGLTAKTREGTEISLKLKNISAASTEVSIRIGVMGDMKMSETVHGLILQELSVAGTQLQLMTPPAGEVR